MAKADSTTTTKRPRKSAAERAQFDLDAAVKRQTSAREKLAKAEASIESLRAEAAQADAEVNFRSQNPALPAQAAEAPQAQTAE